MKRNSKKIISLFLVFVLLFSMSYSAFAAAAETVSGVSVTLSSNKKQYKSGEEIKIKTKVQNDTEDKQYVSIVYSATPLIKSTEMGKYSIKYAEVSGGETAEYEAMGTARRSVFSVEWIQSIYDAVFGSLWSAIYMIKAMFSSSYEAVSVKVDGVSAVVLAQVTSSETLPGEEDPTEPDLSKDTDGDGIPDDIEKKYGADPAVEDTDGDGLSDYWELNWLNLDPTKIDSDNNGISDGDEDTDNDGISNLQEIKYGTSPASADTDNDKLSDYDEIFKYKTDPCNADTDGDGLSDGDEIRNGTNPLVAEKTFVSEMPLDKPDDANSVVATAKVIGDADTVDSLEINPILPGEDIRLSSTIPGYLGYAYEFSVEGKMESAEITFAYDKALGRLGEDFQPRIYYFDESTGLFEEIEDQKVEEGKVTATVTHFSIYVLLNKVELETVWDTEIKPVDYQGNGKNGLDIVFVVDSSGSMSSNDSRGIRKIAVKNFVDKLGQNDRAAIVDFDNYASVYQEFTSDHQLLYSAVERINSSGGTSLSAGMSEAINLFSSNSYKRQDAYKYIVFLTDGDGSYSTSYTKSASDNNIVVYTVGLGSGVKETVLKNIATGTGGKYYFASIASDLPDIYDDVSFETVDYITDSNNDGISDYYTALICNGDMVLSTGSKILTGTDLNYDINGNLSADYDGDGLTNGEELKITQKGNRVYLEMLSNPLDKDSDGDGFSDYEEVKKMKTSPLKTTKLDAPVEYLQDHDNYNYVDFAHDKNIFRKAIVYAFDWEKTKESKANIINYFYDYASQESIDSNATTIAELAAKQKFWETFETVVDVISTLKTVTDAGTKAGCDTAEVERLTKDCTDAKIKALKEHNEKSFKERTGKDIAILSKQLKIVESAEKTVKDIGDVINEHGVGEVTGTVKTITGLISNSISLAKQCNKTWTLPIKKPLANFSNTYQAWMGNTDTLGISNSSKISFAFDVVDFATETANLKNTYGKIMANAQAFENYIELIDYISNNGNDKKYIKDAASELMSILLDTSWETYYDKFEAAIAKEGLKTLANVAISIAGDICPYVKAAELVKDIAVATFSLLGITSYSQSMVALQMYDAISDGSIEIINRKTAKNGLYITYEEDDSEIYIIQLAQSRIVGEKALYDYLIKNNVSNLLRKAIHSQKNSDYKTITSDNINYIYTISNDLKLTLSNNLPICKNNKWIKYGEFKSGGGFR